MAGSNIQDRLARRSDFLDSGARGALGANNVRIIWVCGMGWVKVTSAVSCPERAAGCKSRGFRSHGILSQTLSESPCVTAVSPALRR